MLNMKISVLIFSLVTSFFLGVIGTKILMGTQSIEVNSVDCRPDLSNQREEFHQQGTHNTGRNKGF